MKRNDDAPGARAIFGVAIVIVVAMVVACHDSPTPTEPGPGPTATPTAVATATPVPSPVPTRTPTQTPTPSPTPTSTPIPAPVAIEGHIEGGPTYGGGNKLTMDVCGCTSGGLEVIDGGLPPEPISCSGELFLHAGPAAGSNHSFQITVRSAAWSVTKEFTVPIDPHLGLQARAYCLPVAARAFQGRR